MCAWERKRRRKHALYPFAWATNREKNYAHMFCIKIFSVCDFERQTKCDRINNYIIIDTTFCVLLLLQVVLAWYFFNHECMLNCFIKYFICFNLVFGIRRVEERSIQFRPFVILNFSTVIIHVSLVQPNSWLNFIFGQRWEQKSNKFMRLNYDLRYYSFSIIIDIIDPIVARSHPIPIIQSQIRITLYHLSALIVYTKNEEEEQLTK